MRTVPDVVYKIIDFQSGDVKYTAYESESDPYGYFFVEEVTEVPYWAYADVMEELKELE
jgi:hypothetical protein